MAQNSLHSDEYGKTSTEIIEGSTASETCGAATRRGDGGQMRAKRRDRQIHKLRNVAPPVYFLYPFYTHRRAIVPQ